MNARLSMMVAALLLAGCRDDTRDFAPPAPPQGVYSVTGDGEVTVYWVPNTEPDLAGYRVDIGDCAGGPDCPYDLVGTTSATSMVVSGLADGVTKYFAVAAFDRAGNQSELSKDYVFDTPRPAGTGATLGTDEAEPAISGWDFSRASRDSSDAPETDIYFSNAGGVPRMIAAYTDTDIQDAGYATSLDDVNFAPPSGWSGRDGWALRRTMPPIRTDPVSTGWNGSLTSYCRSSPVPQHDT